MEHDREDLLRQWHPTKNELLTPETVSYGSQRKVWWRCDKGHEWQAFVFDRSSGNKCPYCSNKNVWVGDNDLASQMPELAAQWHPTKNGALTPEQVTIGVFRRVWWQCEKGHEWQAHVFRRSRGDGCPICANKVLLQGENDLATLHPLLAKEWHPEKNGSLTPDRLITGSHRKVWWRCDKGHEWETSAGARLSKNSGCPVCAGTVVVPGENDLASAYPELAKEWHPTKNQLTPQEVTCGSKRKIWWQCKMGHEYLSAVASRTRLGNGCPYCSGVKVLAGFNDLATLEPQIAAQWHQTLNGTLTPDMVTVGSTRNAWWQCQDGHVWKAVVYRRRQNGCPVCAGRVNRKRLDRYANLK